MTHHGVLIVFAGLPGVGKTAIARELAKRIGAVYLRIDSLEHALVESGVVGMDALGPAGYLAAAALAADNLRLGATVVADMVNPWAATRELWYKTAARTAARILMVEVICSDLGEHRRRIEERAADIPGFALPTWADVAARRYEPWNESDTRIDTALISPVQAVEMLLLRLRETRCY